MGLLCRNSIHWAVDANGQPVPHARRYVFVAGKDVLSPVFLDPGLTLQQANPMVADSEGYFQLCYAMDGRYRVIIKCPRGKVLTREDDIGPCCVAPCSGDIGCGLLERSAFPPALT